MNNDTELQSDFQNAIKWKPLLHAVEIGVFANEGVASLTSVVDRYQKNGSEKCRY